jgi:LysM repeat protein
MKATLQLILSAGIVLAACGCTTVYSERQEEADRQASDLAELRQAVRGLKEQTAAITAAQEDVYRQIDRLRGDASAGDPALRQRIEALERSVQALDDARATDRQYIIDDLTKKLSGISRSMQSAAPPPPSSGPTQGYEHVVAAGETLSQIAAAYKVTSAAIIKANNLANPNSLRVGQKLFIPR